VPCAAHLSWEGHSDMPEAVADDDGNRSVRKRVEQAPGAGTVSGDHEAELGLLQPMRVQGCVARVVERAVDAPAPPSRSAPSAPLLRAVIMRLSCSESALATH